MKKRNIKPIKPPLEINIYQGKVLVQLSERLIKFKFFNKIAWSILYFKDFNLNLIPKYIKK